MNDEEINEKKIKVKLEMLEIEKRRLDLYQKIIDMNDPTKMNPFNRFMYYHSLEITYMLVVVAFCLIIYSLVMYV
jgi:hypothetical protein